MTSFEAAAGRAAVDETRAVGGEVLFAEDVIGDVRRVAIATPLGSGLLWRPGQSMEIEVAPRTWRRYVVASANGAGRIEVVVALSSGGPGAWWAATADGGDVVMLRALRDERIFAVDAHRHVVGGDETAIGVCAALARWSPVDAVVGLVEVAPWAAWTRSFAPLVPFTTVRRALAEPGRELAGHLARMVRSGDAVYLVGSRPLVDRCRAALPRDARVITLVTWNG
ncbi:MAG TPA: hypothetical protein VM261_24725 [Kofleriaceae bacterium]|nr:hypothetical protein [Kofleriaceae bacterium]